ncbi:MAG: 23S rRNA (uracil(1939)-C(5))-methyltransferase RlmD [Candidatus Hydrogenedentes bacterium]|nr:23S rRNA (uracil(1939)-C(5))-methyltransferase RlmD [Candidatus Hydrogenedentota bacterium]
MPFCPHFGVCGGCAHQDLDYPAQLAQKAAWMQAWFAPNWNAPVHVMPSPDLWHYRNKVDPAFQPMQYPEPPPKDFDRETVLGFKKKGKWFYPLDIETCLIGPQWLPQTFAAVRDWYREEGSRAWDARSGKGQLRYLLLREGKQTGESMAVLITHSGGVNTASFVDALNGVQAFTSVFHGLYDGKADVARADRLELLQGNSAITETLRIGEGAGARTLAFRISPFSFFQTNTLATEKLYSAIRNWVALAPTPFLYDLYGGAGGIAFSCADLAEEIVSVEEVAEATEDGRYNAGVNGIANVKFVTAKTERFLLNERDAGAFRSGATVILDPPRSALHPKVIKRLLELLPPRIGYISCNPKLLARELAAFSEAYTIESLQAFDLFPHTPHVEAFATLVRR